MQCVFITKDCREMNRSTTIPVGPVYCRFSSFLFVFPNSSALIQEGAQLLLTHYNLENHTVNRHQPHPALPDKVCVRVYVVAEELYCALAVLRSLNQGERNIKRYHLIAVHMEN